jgi:GNAT superfamily N-acetyltransferase
MTTTYDTLPSVELDVAGETVRAGVRPMLDGERETVLEVFDGMSPASRRMRFLTAVPRLPGGMLRLLTAVDHERHGAWVVEVDGRPVAIARWVRLGTSSTAEISLAVVDAWQGRGLGRYLLQLLGVAAAEAGVTDFAWSLDVENRRVLRLLSGLDGSRRTADGVVEARTALPAGHGVDVQVVRRLAAQARAARRATLREAA